MDQNMNGIKALVAEDEILNQFIIKKYIENFGFKVDLAENGRHAIELFEKNEYQIIFLDLYMPIMDGYETASTIRKTSNSIPILALTGNDWETVKADLQLNGFSDYLQKPIKVEELKEKVKKWCNISV